MIYYDRSYQRQLINETLLFFSDPAIQNNNIDSKQNNKITKVNT